MKKKGGNISPRREIKIVNDFVSKDVCEIYEYRGRNFVRETDVHAQRQNPKREIRGVCASVCI